MLGLCLHQQENKHIFTPKCNGSQLSCLSNEKYSKGDKTTDYFDNYKILFALWKMAFFKETATLSQSHYLYHILIGMPPLHYSRYIYIYIYIYIFWVSLYFKTTAWRVFLKLRNDCDANLERNWIPIQFQKRFWRS